MSVADQEYDIHMIMQNQPVMNVGTTGHVANGKSTITKCLSSKETQKFSKEKERNITIRLGYANTKIWRCDICEPPSCYSSSDSSTMRKNCSHCDADLELVNHISIVDCPGHSELTSTMLNGSSVMDYAILVEACNNDNIPAAQTAEHLVATRTAGIPTTMIIMNKIDLINKEKAYLQIKKIKDYVSSLTGSNSHPFIVPVSATFGTNIDVVCHRLSKLEIPRGRDPLAQFKMICIRSFDINKPGSEPTKLHGGVIGGTIMRGSLRVGDRVNIYPGMTKRLTEDEQKERKCEADFKYAPVSGVVLSIKSETNDLAFAIPGGLLGIQLTIDPAFARNDMLAGSLVLKTKDVDDGSIVRVFDKIIIKMSTLLIADDMLNKLMKTSPQLMININSNNIDCKVHKYSKSKKELFLFLNKPIAIDSKDNLATVMNKNNSKDIIGRGVIVDGVVCDEM
jgi:translation initiation factor 2 subunit 3